MEYGSDAIAAVLRELDFCYVALNPGASFRGLHDSIVKYLGNENPEILVCLHEGHALAIAHGYAKATLRPMLAIVHSNVGLMHATHGLFQAWLDRVPLVLIAANGPIDAMKRRPYQDWIHSVQDAGALVRNYTKWDDEPASVEAALESIVRAYQVACTPPYGPTFITLDAALQEEKLNRPVALPELGRLRPPAPAQPTTADVERTRELLTRAQRPLIMLGRMSRSEQAWNERVALAEALGARVVTDQRTAASFPTDHLLHVPMRERAAAVREADVLLALEWVDLGGTLRTMLAGERPAATIVACSVDRYLHNGWSFDHQPLFPADLSLAADVDAFVHALSGAGAPRAAAAPPARNGAVRPAAADGPIGVRALCAEVAAATAGESPTIIRMPIGGDVDDFVLRDPLSYLIVGGGGGIGIGPGNAVGAALALRGSGRLPVALLGDGDFLMGVTALWTAVSNEIPLLVVVANNRSYFNDETHQAKMALDRGRPVERKWIGQRLDDPPIDIAGIARVQGAVGLGPVERRGALAGVLADAIRAVRDGAVCVVDVRVDPELDAQASLAQRAAETKRS
jgi:thiamine pyrophosphate-dependent acetolactate synthase large subunit-like protein